MSFKNETPWSLHKKETKRGLNLNITRKMHCLQCFSFLATIPTTPISIYVADIVMLVQSTS